MEKRSKKEKRQPRQAELSKRGAARLAATTAGRARIFKNRKKYDRKAEDREDLKAARRALKESGSIPWEELKKNLNIKTVEKI